MRNELPVAFCRWQNVIIWQGKSVRFAIAKFPLMNNVYLRVRSVPNTIQLAFCISERFPQLRITHYELRIRSQTAKLQFSIPKKKAPPERREPLPRRGGQDQQPPQQQENSRTMRMIQIQLLLSKTLHRQLFIVCLLIMK